MSQGHFDNGRWVNNEPNFPELTQEQKLLDALKQMKDETKEYRERRDKTALEYFRYMSFLDRLKYLIFPDRYLK